MRKVHIVRGRRILDYADRVFIDSVFASKKRADARCFYKNQDSTQFVYFVTTYDLL